MRYAHSPSRLRTARLALATSSSMNPARRNLPILGKIVAAIRRHAPGKLAYINLLPSYATAGAPGKSQLEAKSFTEYLERYVAEVKPEFLSYDNYMVEFRRICAIGGRGRSTFAILLEVRRVSHGARFAVLEHRDLRSDSAEYDAAVAGEFAAAGMDDAGGRRPRRFVVQVQAEGISVLPDRFGAQANGNLVLFADGESPAEGDWADREPA